MGKHTGSPAGNENGPPTGESRPPVRPGRLLHWSTDPARRASCELPQGRKAARVNGLCRVRGVPFTSAANRLLATSNRVADVPGPARARPGKGARGDAPSDPDRVDEPRGTRVRARAPDRELRASCRTEKLTLDLTRGKPSPEQLDLSSGAAHPARRGDYRDGTAPTAATTAASPGCRNCARSSASCSAFRPNNLLAGNNASLEIMHDLHRVRAAARHPRLGAAVVAEPRLKFLCPSPGYDRHFAITESLGIEMIPIPMRRRRPGRRRRRRARRRAIRRSRVCGRCRTTPTRPVRCTRKRSCVSWRRCRPPRPIPAVLGQRLRGAPADRGDRAGARRARHGRRGRVPEPSVRVRVDVEDHLRRRRRRASSVRRTRTWPGTRRTPRKKSIGPDKLNQLRHLRFFGNADGVRAHMAQAPRDPRAEVRAGRCSILEDRLGASKVASWTEPKGGYFISLDVLDGTAARVDRAGQGRGHRAHRRRARRSRTGTTRRTSNIRIAPSFPPPPNSRRRWTVSPRACCWRRRRNCSADVF